MARTFTACIEYDPEQGVYAGRVTALPGAHSQGETLDGLLRNLREVIALCLEEAAARGEPVEEDHFAGIYEITIPAWP